jgi:hypothetical protein
MQLDNWCLVGLGLDMASVYLVLKVVQAVLSESAAHMLFMAERSLVLDLVSTHNDPLA